MEISVILAVKNEEIFIEEALRSILTQSDVDFEVVVIDDSSTDTTFSKLRALSEEFPMLRVERNPGRGKVSAFNFGVQFAQGQFVCLFAGDDVMPLGSLKKRLDFVRMSDPSRPVVGLSKIRTLSDNPKLNEITVPRKPGIGNPSGQSPLMNRSALDLLFPVPENLPNEDTWFEIAFCHTNLCEVIHGDTICCIWRIHAGNSYNYNLEHRSFKDRITARRHAYTLFLRRYLSELNDSQKELLEAQVQLTSAYREGRVWSILFNWRVSYKDRLRLIATATPTLYFLRRNFFAMFSGW